MSGHGDSLQEKMAAASFAWLSMVVKRGATTLVPRKIVRVGWESNFGELLGNVYQEISLSLFLLLLNVLIMCRLNGQVGCFFVCLPGHL